MAIDEPYAACEASSQNRKAIEDMQKPCRAGLKASNPIQQESTNENLHTVVLLEEFHITS